MNNVVDTEVTMCSTEIAKLTGKDHKNVLVDIRKMLEELGFLLSDEGQSAEFSADYKDARGRSQQCFKLPRELTEVLILGYSAQLRLKVVRRLRELERLAAPSPPAPQPLSHIQDMIGAIEMMSRIVGAVPGVKPGIVAAATLTCIHEATGIPVEAMRRALPPSEHPTEALLNATQLGKRLGISGQKVNRCLADAGLQQRDDQGNWILTPTGSLHAEAMPFERNGHTGYQVVWRESVIPLIETH